MVPSDLVAYLDTTLRLKRSRLAGVPYGIVRDALIRVAAITRARAVQRSDLADLLRRELRRVMSASTAARTAERALVIIAPDQLQPSSTTSRTPSRVSAAINEEPSSPDSQVQNPSPSRGSTLQVSAHELPTDRQSIYRTLRETDLARDFPSGLSALTTIFKALQGGAQPHVTRVFLEALENRFALVASNEAVMASRRAYGRPHATLKDVQGLLTTKGIAIADRGSRLMAWRVDPTSAECASIEANALSSYLNRGVLPQMHYAVIGRGQTSSDSGLRDLAGFAESLRSRETRLLPLAVDPSGITTREWTGMQLRRMGHRSPHRVREHLRLVPSSGERTVVSEHARFGIPGWTDAAVRIRLL